MIDQLIWARWPWQRCKGVYVNMSVTIRCDRKKHQMHDHASQSQGMVLFWKNEFTGTAR